MFALYFVLLRSANLGVNPVVAKVIPVLKRKRKLKYYFNPQSLSYEKALFNWRLFLLRSLGIFSGSLVITVLVFIFFYYYIDSPKEVMLMREIDAYRQNIESYDQTLTQLNARLATLDEKDREIYRTIFESNDTQISIGNLDTFAPIKDPLQRMNAKLEFLKGNLARTESSFHDLAQLALKKQELLASIPAIQPISNKQLKYLASGYGMRVHPVYKTVKMHTGIDFSAPTGSEIYATGNGRVIFSGNDASGYGNHVIVDHGFGYQTLYAHMSKINARRGQIVKRGELLGWVGNTGLSVSPHLHYEVIKGQNKVNPVYYFHNDLTPEEYQTILERAEAENQSFD